MGNQCSSPITAWHEIVLEPVERSWLHRFALAAEPESCWLEHHTALSCSNPVWSISDCIPVTLQVLQTVGDVPGIWQMVWAW